jgi:hypothetical protein
VDEATAGLEERILKPEVPGGPAIILKGPVGRMPSLDEPGGVAPMIDELSDELSEEKGVHPRLDKLDSAEASEEDMRALLETTDPRLKMGLGKTGAGIGNVWFTGDE